MGWAGLPFSLPWDARSSAFVTFVVPADGVPLVDLTQLFADMRRAPGDYIWLMVTLFSTLLPTLLHLSVAALTLGLQYPAGCAILWPVFWSAESRAGKRPSSLAYVFAP